MKKSLKRKLGFTLTELAIVIAVIAILVAVLVPTFIALINKANQSVDEQTVTNLNKVLAVDEATDGKPDSLCGVWDVLAENDYNTSPDPNYSANKFYWYKSANRIVIVSGGKVTFPAEYEGITIDGEASAAYYQTAKAAVAESTLTANTDVYYLGIDEDSSLAHASGCYENYGDICPTCHRQLVTETAFDSYLTSSSDITLQADLTKTYTDTKTYYSFSANIPYTINKTVPCTIDLNGKTLTIESAAGYNGIKIAGTSSSIQNGTIVVSKSASATFPAVDVANVDLTIKNSTIKLTESGVCLKAAGKDSNDKISTLVIEDSTIIHENADSASDSSISNVTIDVGSESPLTIKGNSKIVGLIRMATTATVTIENGDFTECEFKFNDTQKIITLSGGTFSETAYNQIVNQSNLKDGYEWQDNGDGTYSVVESSSQAE